MHAVEFLDRNTFLVIGALVEKKHYLRELAEKTGLAPSTVHKVASKMLKKKVLLAERRKNQKLLVLNQESPLAAKCVSLLFINSILESRAFAKLVALKPRGVFLFGTAASGKATGNSDIDLAVFFEKKPGLIKLTDAKRELSNELEREIQLVVLTPEKLAAMKKEKTELLNEILNRSVVLWGKELERS